MTYKVVARSGRSVRLANSLERFDALHDFRRGSTDCHQRLVWAMCKRAVSTPDADGNKILNVLVAVVDARTANGSSTQDCDHPESDRYGSYANAWAHHGNPGTDYNGQEDCDREGSPASGLC